MVGISSFLWTRAYNTSRPVEWMHFSKVYNVTWKWWKKINRWRFQSGLYYMHAYELLQTCVAKVPCPAILTCTVKIALCIYTWAMVTPVPLHIAFIYICKKNCVFSSLKGSILYIYMWKYLSKSKRWRLPIVNEPSFSYHL